MRLTDFDIYQALLKERSGLVITPDKAYLLESRLNPVAKKWGFDGLNTLTIALQGVPDKQMVKDIVEAMTTNETSFFRDQNPFDRLKEVVLPHMLKTRMNHRRMRTWCAAASSGQEPYSIAMILKEMETQFTGWRNEIIGTDLSDEILAKAREGLYTQFEVQRGLPIQLLMKYFTQEGDKWRINEPIRKMISYQPFNLLESMAAFGQFDIIFCRNVLIYFDEKTKADILNRMSKHLAPDGFLFLGGAETVIGITDVFKPMPGQRGLYVHENSPHLVKAA
ncbi:MAG: protein-glutamate O-methyltransferase [Alphaproteobacteria bacterium]|nr:protein-glutamate O-methyltransferase [Alphaproteobacteria bacterium]